MRQLDLSATDSPRSALGSPLSEMCGYKLSSHEQVVLEERHVNPMLLKCLEDDVHIPGPSTPIYTDPTMVHVTLNHAFGRCRNKLTKQHQSMSLDAWVTGNQLAGQRPFDVPLTEKQTNNPARQPLVPPTALLNYWESSGNYMELLSFMLKRGNGCYGFQAVPHLTFGIFLFLRASRKGDLQ